MLSAKLFESYVVKFIISALEIVEKRIYSHVNMNDCSLIDIVEAMYNIAVT